MVQFGKMSKIIRVAEILPGIKDKVGQHNAAPVVFSWRNLWRFKSAAEDQSPGDKKKWVMKQACFFCFFF